jgi:methyl-accepting chemotaxis protein
MKNWSVATRLIVGFGLATAITAALGAIAANQLYAVEARSKRITEDALPGVALVGRIRSINLHNLALLMEYVATDARDRQELIEARMVANSAEASRLMEAYERTISQPRDRELFEAARQARQVNAEKRRQFMVDSRGSHEADEALARFDTELKPVYDAYLKAMNDLMVYNEAAGATYATAITTTVTSAIMWTVVGVLFAVAASFGIGLVIVRGTNKVLGDSVAALSTGAEQVVSAAGQVAASAQTLSQGATEQAASLEETSASMEEMASMARRNADHTHEAAGLMSQVDLRVTQSNGVLQAMVTSMGAIQESSSKVARIIRTIDEIAFQTNILALNAAVEAARAGEAGMGFAVVADEVRGLAQRSAQAARETEALIEESIARSQEGSRKVTEVAASFGAITESVTRVKGLVHEVREASHQQTQGIEQVAQAVTQMEKVTQSSAATAEENAAASEELNAQAESSMAVVRSLAALVGGAPKAGPTPRPRNAKTLSRPRVTPMPTTSAARATSAEEAIPLGDTGTYGRF